MTNNQFGQAKELITELKTNYPEIDWRTSYNYYTKLVEFTAVKEDLGGFEFRMTKHYDGSTELALVYNPTTKGEKGMTVSHGFGTDIVRESLPRLNWKRYMEFVREYAPQVADKLVVAK